MSAPVADDTLEHWKRKCKELENVVKTLSSHCFKVVEKHEELLVKSKANEEQYETVVVRLKESEGQLAKMRNLYEPVCTEFEVMRNKFEIEMECRHQAEMYATKVTQQNKVLKRQSQMLQQQQGLVAVEISLDDPPPPVPDKEDESQKEYMAALNTEISKLEEDNAKLKAQLTELRDDCDVERSKKKQYSIENERLKTELTQSTESLQQHKDALKRLGNETAFQEFHNLKGNYEEEVVCRDQAEKYAATLFAEREAAKRQSNMLLMNIGPDQKLMEAMIEVENLTTKVEGQRAEFESQIQSLEEELRTLREREVVESLEQDNARLVEERDGLVKQLTATEGQVAALRADYDKLLEQYGDLEKKLEEKSRPPPPPLPPPPPPPPLPTKLNIFGRGKRKKEIIQNNLEKGGASVNNDYSKALEEMMKRIKEGSPLKRTLKPVRRPSCPEETDISAMSELKGMLTKIKKASSEGDLTSPKPDENDKSELAQMFLKIRKPSTKDEKDTKTDGDVVLRNPRSQGPKQLSRVSEGEEVFTEKHT